MQGSTPLFVTAIPKIQAFWRKVGLTRATDTSGNRHREGRVLSGDDPLLLLIVLLVVLGAAAEGGGVNRHKH